jgi:hypothetical protein
MCFPGWSPPEQAAQDYTVNRSFPRRTKDGRARAAPIHPRGDSLFWHRSCLNELSSGTANNGIPVKPH